MRPTGKVNLIGLCIVLALLAAAYWAVIFGPVYYDNLEVKDAVNRGFNAAANGTSTEAMVHSQVLGRFKDPAKFGFHSAPDPVTNLMTQMPGLPVNDDQIIVVIDETRKTILVRVEYDRVVVLSPTKKRRTVHFVVERSGPIPR